MTLGFSDPERVKRLRSELTQWTLYQVTVDKYHVMFWFENGHALLNTAHRFEVVFSPTEASVVYDVQAEGERKLLFVDNLLRNRVISVHPLDQTRLELGFEGGGKLILHDNPSSRSCWFYKYNTSDHDAPLLWCEEDEDGEQDL